MNIWVVRLLDRFALIEKHLRHPAWARRAHRLVEDRGWDLVGKTAGRDGRLPCCWHRRDRRGLTLLQ
jgi:hypothetical protein